MNEPNTSSNYEPQIIITSPGGEAHYSLNQNHHQPENSRNHISHHNQPNNSHDSKNHHSRIDKHLIGNQSTNSSQNHNHESQLPPDRPLDLQIPDDHDYYGAKPFQRAHSKSPGARVTVVPRGGSFEERESFKAMKYGPQTPQERRKAEHQRKRQGPSSRNTVVTVAGLLIVGLMFIVSGLIVLLTENNALWQLQTTGGVFLTVGVLMLLVCGMLQRKNWIRYMDQLDEDLYFLRLGSNPVWKLMKLDMLDFTTLGTTHGGGSGSLKGVKNKWLRGKRKHSLKEKADRIEVQSELSTVAQTPSAASTDSAIQGGVVNRAFRGSEDSITRL